MKNTALGLVLLLVSTFAIAQVNRASLSGVVHDATGGAIPGAQLSATNSETGVISKAISNSEGAYLIAELQPGRYTLEVSAPGFQAFRRTVILETAQRARLEIALLLGAMTETVEVDAARPLLDTQSAVVGTVIDQNEISKLPLAIRNWDDMLALVPGVQSDRYTEQSGGTSSGRTGGVNVHGNRSLQNNFLLDGVSNNSFSENVQELSTQISRPSVDAIQEFKVVTSPFSAEYGWAPGASIVVNTKSGTNQIRGTLYDYYRNDKFDAKNYFAQATNQPKQSNHQNQYGFNLGGPVMRNRAFFFADYENTGIKQGVLRVGRVFSEAERRGVFSSAVRDPLTGKPFVDNTIPQDRIDPVVAKIIAMIPAANATGSSNFIRQPLVDDHGKRILARADLNATDSDNLFARLIRTDRVRFVPGFFGGILDGTSTSAWGRSNLKSEAAVAGWTKIVGSSMVNEFRFSYAAADSDSAQEPFGQDGLSQIGFKGVPNDPRILGGIMGIDISGHIRLGSPNFLPKFQHTRQFQYLDTFSALRGNHQLKTGFDVLAPMKNQYVDIPSTRGNLSFNGAFTGNAFADFLLGYAVKAELSNVDLVEQRLWGASAFVQDDWTVTDSVTLNLGLRYDFITPALEANNQMANFDPNSGTLVFAKNGSLEDRALVKPDRNNLAPRLGVVYRLNDRTIFRGGFGIFYNQFDRIGSEDQLALNPPGLRNIVVQSSSANPQPVLIVQNGFPTGYLDPSNVVYKNLLIRAADPNGERPETRELSLGVERQLGQAFLITADGITTRGRNIAILRNLNQPLPGTLDANGPVPYPTFAHIQWREMSGKSRYNGVDLSLQKRMSQGYGFRVSYTYGNSKDQAPEHLAASSGRPQNGRDLNSWWGPSDFDIRHRVVSDFTAEAPFGAGRRWAQSGLLNTLFGGWNLSGIYSYRSGRPFTVTQGTNNVGPGATGLPNLIGDPGGPRSIDRFFNTGAFQKVTSGTFGNAGRNILRGPTWTTVDMSLQRVVALHDQFSATLRWDVFNVFNRSNFGLPDSNIDSRTFGVISSLAGDPRIMQFAVRFNY